MEVKKVGNEWSVYAEGKLLQDGLSSEALALKVAAAVNKVIELYAGKEDYHRRSIKSTDE